MIELLRSVELFEGLDDESLAPLAATGRERLLAPGEVLVTEGDGAEFFLVLASGRIEWLRTVNGEEVVLGTRAAPSYAGAINLLTGEPVLATGRADDAATVVAFDGDAFRRLVGEHPELVRRIVGLIAPVQASAEAAIRQREKLAALGTLAAGLAHELNNPAAAARRTSAELGVAMNVLQETLHAFVSSGVERTEAARLVDLQRQALERGVETGELDALERSDREEALAALLEKRGLDGWRLAEPLAAAGVDEAWLEDVAANAGVALGAALEWVAASLTARGLVAELHESVSRISEIVGAVKDYTYMDRDSVQEIDIHDGIESTLTMLAHKLKQGDVRVERAYDQGLPRIRVHGSELNQVWTNLIDNAIDAVAGHGTITLRSCRSGEDLLVEVIDDGPGIPSELVSRVLEPFFTTKEPGKGTGLGLDITRRIVEGHGGRLTVESRPGETRFAVRLPLDAS